MYPGIAPLTEAECERLRQYLIERIAPKLPSVWDGMTIVRVELRADARAPEGWSIVHVTDTGEEHALPAAPILASLTRAQ